MMPNGEKDISYAFSLYNRMLDSVTVDGKQLGSVVVLDRYNLWDVFRHLILFDDCARFSVQKTYEVVKPHYLSTNKGTFRGGAFLVGMGFWALTKVSILFLLFSRRRVLIFSVDKESAHDFCADFRIERIYRLLKDHHVRYVEFFHTLVRKDSLLRAVRRQRPALYLEAIDWLYFALRLVRRLFVERRKPIRIEGLDSFSEEEKIFVHALVTKYMSVAPLVAFRIKILKFVLRLSNIKLVVGIDDARYYHEIAAAASELAIPFYVFQHGVGHLTQYHVGWLRDNRLRGICMHPDYFVVWNEFWKDEALALPVVWDRVHVVVGGNAKAVDSQRFLKGGSQDPVLIPFEPDAPRALVREYIARLDRMNISVMVKLRSDIALDTQREMFTGLTDRIEYVEAVQKPISAVLATYSTMLYEAVQSGVPAGLLGSPLPYSRSLAEKGVYALISEGSFESDILKLIHTPEQTLANVRRAAEPASFAEWFSDMLRKNHIV